MTAYKHVLQFSRANIFIITCTLNNVCCKEKIPQTSRLPTHRSDGYSFTGLLSGHYLIL